MHKWGSLDAIANFFFGFLFVYLETSKVDCGGLLACLDFVVRGVEARSSKTRSELRRRHQIISTCIKHSAAHPRVSIGAHPCKWRYSSSTNFEESSHEAQLCALPLFLSTAAHRCCITAIERTVERDANTDKYTTTLHALDSACKL